jgi:hypothetical protein
MDEAPKRTYPTRWCSRDLNEAGIVFDCDAPFSHQETECFQCRGFRRHGDDIRRWGAQPITPI